VPRGLAGVLAAAFGRADVRGVKDGRGRRIEVVPIRLEYACARLARGEEAKWISQRFRTACAELGTEAREEQGRLSIAKHWIRRLLRQECSCQRAGSMSAVTRLRSRFQ
jgi:hypothetical protein